MSVRLGRGGIRPFQRVGDPQGHQEGLEHPSSPPWQHPQPGSPLVLWASCSAPPLRGLSNCPGAQQCLVPPLVAQDRAARVQMFQSPHPLPQPGSTMGLVPGPPSLSSPPDTCIVRTHLLSAATRWAAPAGRNVGDSSCGIPAVPGPLAAPSSPTIS